MTLTNQFYNSKATKKPFAKILAIDNSEINLKLLSKIVKVYYPEFIFITAECGKTGFEIADKEQPDLILLDVLLADMNGYDMCKALKESKSTSHIPVIIISALGQDSEERIKGLNAGADAFLSKPFSKDELKAQIDVVIRIKQTEDLLRERNEKLINLNKEIILVEEKERRLIAENLHDSLGQTLSLAYFNLSAINQDTEDTRLHSIINDTSMLLDKAISESRVLTYDLSPPILYELGLVAAIKWKLEQIEKKNKFKTTLTGKEQKLYISKEYSIFLFRIVNELLTNIIKHAKANLVEVKIMSNKNSCTIIVCDDGDGFVNKGEKKPDTKGGFGLISIAERIEDLNGTFEIDSRQEKGTQVKITIPNTIT